MAYGTSLVDVDIDEKLLRGLFGYRQNSINCVPESKAPRRFGT